MNNLTWHLDEVDIQIGEGFGLGAQEAVWKSFLTSDCAASGLLKPLVNQQDGTPRMTAKKLLKKVSGECKTRQKPARKRSLQGSK